MSRSGSAPALGAGSGRPIRPIPTRGSLAQREERPVEAREVPGQFRGEPPCPTGLTAMTPVFQTGDRGSIPRWGSRALRAIRVKHSTLNRGIRGSSPRRRTQRGSRATGRRGGFKYRTVRVRIPPPLPDGLDKRCPFVQPEGRRSLKASIVVRIHGGQRRRRARLRLRFRTADGPGRHRVAALLCSYSNHGREAGPRCQMLRVRIPPSARSQRLSMGGGATGSPPSFDLGWSRFESWSPSS
jgi:hypothetical protein